MKVIETTLQQVRQAEQISRTDLISSISTLSELKIVSDVQHRKIEDLENKLQESVDEAQRYQDKLVEIRDRCNQLTMSCEEERNKRSDDLHPPSTPPILTLFCR
jgi:flagellar biosynthesis chaperone FliJ